MQPIDIILSTAGAMILILLSIIAFFGARTYAKMDSIERIGNSNNRDISVVQTTVTDLKNNFDKHVSHDEQMHRQIFDRLEIRKL